MPLGPQHMHAFVRCCCPTHPYPATSNTLKQRNTTHTHITTTTTTTAPPTHTQTATRWRMRQSPTPSTDLTGLARPPRAAAPAWLLRGRLPPALPGPRVGRDASRSRNAALQVRITWLWLLVNAVGQRCWSMLLVNAFGQCFWSMLLCHHCWVCGRCTLACSASHSAHPQALCQRMCWRPTWRRLEVPLPSRCSL